MKKIKVSLGEKKVRRTAVSGNIRPEAYRKVLMWSKKYKVSISHIISRTIEAVIDDIELYPMREGMK